MSPCIGVYNEAAFQGLDRLIADAGQRGVKLIITMTDNWHLQDGLQQVCICAVATCFALRDCCAICSLLFVLPDDSAFNVNNNNKCLNICLVRPVWCRSTLSRLACFEQLDCDGSTELLNSLYKTSFQMVLGFLRQFCPTTDHTATFGQPLIRHPAVVIRPLMSHMGNASGFDRICWSGFRV